MTKRTLFFGCFSIVLILACVPSTSAQVATGFPPFSSVATAPSGPDALNPANLNMHWTIPIFSKPGRGIPFVYNLTYDSSIWYPSGSTPYVYWTPTTNWGWSILNANQTGSLNVTPSGSTDCYVAGDYRGTTYFYNVYYQDPLGTSHYMGYAFYIDGGGDCEGQGPGSYPLSGSASDGSGFQIVSFLVFSPSTGMLNNMGTIITPSGATMVVPVMANNPVPATSITDSNGNEITTTAGTYIFNANYTQVTATGGVYTDSLGATVLTIAGSGTPASPITFTYPTPSGSNATVTMRYSSYNVRTHFGCSGVGEYSVSSGQNLVSEIDLPDNTKYTFTYEPTPGYSGYVTGRVASVAMPTGGTISYSYTGSNNGVVCHDGSAAGLTRTTPDGSWYYSRTTASPYLTTTTSVTPPGSIGHSVLTFSSQLLTGEQDYNASGTLLRTTLTCFNGTLPTGNPPSCASGIDSPLRHAEYVYWPNGQVGRRDTFYSSNTLPILPTEVDEYDYGSGAPGPLLRKTLTTYATNLGNIINKPASVTIEDGSNAIKAQTTYTYDQGSVTGTTGVPQHVSVSGSRGNLTTVTKLVQGSTTVSATNTYYDTGNVQYAYDFKSNPTTYGYSSAYGYAYPTTVTNALNQTTTYTYNAYTGLVASVTDPNNQTTSSSYDFMLRPTQVSYPDGGLTTKCYTDVGGSTCSASSAPFKTVTTQKMNSTQNLITTAVTDGLGRVVEQQVNSDPDGWVYTDNSFDALGRPYCASNPYRSTSDPTYGLTCNTYDALGRLTTVTNPDGTAISTSYTGRATSVQDEGNGTQHVQRVSQVDGLGRLASLCEVTSAALTVGISGSTTPAACGQDIAATGFLTTYAYDTLDNLMSVAQGPLNARTFSYDSLSRLTSATNPESGTTSYTYDADSNVITKTDARGVTTCFGTWTGSSCNASSGYDALNHLLTKTYSDGTTPAVTYNYGETSSHGVSLVNTIGRMSSESTAGANATGSVFSYDQMGRVANNSQCTPQNCSTTTFPVAYTYDLMGDVLTSTNGAGVTLTNAYNAAAQLTTMTSSLSDSNHPAALLGNSTTTAHYNAAGALVSVPFGNGLSETRTYDQRLRLTGITDGSVYSMTIPSTGGYAPNGNILAANDSVNGNWTYSYDPFNRLTGSNKNSSTVIYAYAYDRFGNRWTQQPTTGTGASSSLGFDANNRIVSGSGVSYDAAGNTTADGVHTYAYDAENRLMSVDGGSTASYVYDADGRRVRKTTSGASVDFLYDLAGTEVSQFTSAGVWNRGEVYADGRHLATYSGGTSGTTYFIHADWLGTERARSNLSGGSYETCVSLTFGDWLTCAGADVSLMHFTGKERDSESGLDNFLARYDSSSMGRFMSPDWSEGPDPVPYADMDDPQSLNLYSYVGNNPATDSDPDGHCGQNEICVNSFYFTSTSDSNNSEDYLGDWVRFYQTVKDGTARIASQVVNWMTAPRNPTCMAVAKGTYALAGAYKGAETGAAGLVLAGTGEVVTVPAGAILGGAGGYVVGGAVGFVACKTGSGGGGSKGSTGRAAPNGTKEADAMAKVKADPSVGTDLSKRGLKMTDPRWPASQGWVKMARNVDGVEIHWVRNTITGAVDDFKFK